MRALDGPAVDANLSLRCCPRFLRLTIGPRGKVDALDQPGDVPNADEAVYAYRIVPGSFFVVYVRPGGRFEFGEYRIVDSQPAAEVLLDRDRWVAWVKDVLRDEGVAETDIESNRVGR